MSNPFADPAAVPLLLATLGIGLVIIVIIVAHGAWSLWTRIRGRK